MRAASRGPAHPGIDEEERRTGLVDPSNGSQSTFTSGNLLSRPMGVVIGAGGGILVADYSGGVVRVDPLTRLQSIFASGGSLQGLMGIALDLDGNILVSDDTSQAVVRLDAGSGAELDVYDGGSLDQPLDIATVKVAVPEPSATLLALATLATLRLTEGGGRSLR